MRPSFSLHLVGHAAEWTSPTHPRKAGCRSLDQRGLFIFRREIFDYLREGDELVEAPFQRLIEADQLMAFRHEGFWRPMDTFKDKEVLEDLVEKADHALGSQ